MSNSRTARRQLPKPPPAEDEEDLVDIGTAVAIAALPAFLTTEDDIPKAVALAFQTASTFIAMRERWAEEVEDYLETADAR